MIDLTFIGKEGLVIDYEDIISLVGMNVISYLISKDTENKIVVRMSSIEDILNSYIDRPNYDISFWLKEHFGLDFDITRYLNSPAMFKPNALYAYKLLPNAYLNGIKNLYIYSQYESDVIKRNITAFECPVKYVHGDIRDIMKDKVNYTYITANPGNVKKCLDVKAPFALTICDDYMSMAPVVQEHVDDQLRKNGKFVSYTSILSAGGNA